MCGIAGALGYLDEDVVSGVRRASRRERHRGPDAEGFYASTENGPGVVLAHRRLAIIDLSDQGLQPMFDADTGIMIVFNGEIYNYHELRIQLEANGTNFRSRCDTEVLLQAYVRWGDNCLDHLNGMFAFAIWDPLRHCMLLARDRFGIKPLYFIRVVRPEGETILFASELRALLASGLVERRIDPLALQTYLWHGFVVGEQSLVQGVQRLAAGTAMSVEFESLTMRKWLFWRLPSYAPRIGALEELSALLEESVQMRLEADVPLGVFLSGGIDSSAILALAARDTSKQLRTFNVAFEEAKFDESVHARAIANQVGAEHCEVSFSRSSFFEHMDDAIGSLDQPSFDGINTYFISRAVREAGINVALSGTGGDELFGGYASFVDLPNVARVARMLAILPRSFVRGLVRTLAYPKLRLNGGLESQTRWGKLPDALASGRKLIDLYQISCGLFTPRFLRALAPELNWSQTYCGLQSDYRKTLEDRITDSPLLHGISQLELGSFIGERLLPDTDSASMAVGLEVRVPLLDHRIVEALAGIDIKSRFQPVGRKQLLRQLGLKNLSSNLFDRPKQGFELPMRDWITNSGSFGIGPKLHERITSTFSDRSACSRVGLEPRTLDCLWRAMLDDTGGIYWSRPWALFILMDWCEREHVSL